MRSSGSTPIGSRLRRPDLGYPLPMQIALPMGLGVSVVGDAALRRATLAALDPFPDRSADTVPATDPDGPVFVVRGERPDRRSRYRELQLLAGDGHVTAYDGVRLWLLDGDAACAVPSDDWGSGADVTIERGFPVARAFRSIIRPALQLAIAERAGVAVHASCVEVDGCAVLIAGWSESGKTETALAFVEAGASFLTDKWTVINTDRQAAAFPIGVGVRGWVLRYLPHLRHKLPLAARAQLGVAGAGKVLAAPLDRWKGDRRVAQLAAIAVRRSIALADRAALTPSDIRRLYGETRDPARQVPVSLVAVLRTGSADAIAIRDGDAEALSARLAQSAATERGDFLALLQRAAYAEGRVFDASPLIERDRRAIRSLFDSVPVIDVTAPFPTDPRRVMDAVSTHL
jgi:hypothetical protein